MSAATFLYFLKSIADGVFQPCGQTSKYFSYFLFHIKAVIFHRVRKSTGSFFDFFSKSTCIFRRVVYIIKSSRDIAQPGLARLSGGQKVASSNLAIPTIFFALKLKTPVLSFFFFRQKKHEAVRLRFIAPQVRFMAQRAASYGAAVLHKSLTMKHCSVSLHNMKQLHFIQL